MRQPLEEDLPIFFEHQRDPVAIQMAGFTPRDRNEFMAHWAKILADPAVIKKTIVFDGHVSGFLVCFERHGKREVGYWIVRKDWGKGIATLALSRFMVDVEERPLYALVAKHNVASRRVLEKCGFAVAGENHGSVDGRSSDVEDLILKLEATDPWI